MAKSHKYFSNGMCQSFKSQPVDFRSKSKILIDPDKGFYLFWETDKNNQICNCSRIGTVFDKIHGQPENLVSFSILSDAYIDMLNSEKEMEIITNNDNEIVSAKLL